MSYERVTRGTKDAPYGKKADGSPRKKPGRKSDKQRARLKAAKKRSK